MIVLTVMEDLTELLLPLGVCVVMPVLIVWLVARSRQNETNRKTEIMLKAIESGVAVDADFFKDNDKKGSVKYRLLSKLSKACVCSFLGIAMIACAAFILEDFFKDLLLITGAVVLAVGIAYFIVYFIGRRMFSKEIESEEKALSK